MLLVKPSVEILTSTPFPLQLIEVSGRTCYKSTDRITPDSSADFVKMLIKRGHLSVIEHASVTVRFICDRGVSHEIVRHRLASFSQESTRYCDYADGHVSFVIPPFAAAAIPGTYSGLGWLLNQQKTETDHWFCAMIEAEKYYTILREKGWSPQQARSVLPNSLKTEVVMTANLREWRHFLELRTSAAAHPQMREIAVPLLSMLQDLVPVVFADIKGD